VTIGSASSETSERDHPMATRSRSKASGAGLQGEGNSGATGKSVTKSDTTGT
jgi:hypothetical protein